MVLVQGPKIGIVPFSLLALLKLLSENYTNIQIRFSQGRKETGYLNLTATFKVISVFNEAR